jgi:Acetyltransferase (GNAT) domain
MELRITTPEYEEWDDFFGEYVPETDENVEYTLPGTLSRELASMCRGEFTSEKIMNFADVSTHLLELYNGNTRVGFLLLDANDSEIHMVCVSQKGQNASKILIDKAKQIVKSEGKKTIHLTASNPEVGEKVYVPQGFTFDDEYKERMTAKLGGKRRQTRKKTRRI